MQTRIIHGYHRFSGEYFYYWPTWFFWDEIIVPGDEDDYRDEVCYFVRIGICRNPYGTHNLIATVEICRGMVSTRQETITGNRAVLEVLEKLGVDVEKVRDLLNRDKRWEITNAYFAETAC